MSRLEVLKTYKIYIGGQFPRTESGRFYPFHDPKGNMVANVCLSSRKDVRNAVTAARKAFGGWSERSAFNRGQIIYRIAEMLEGRRAQFIEELMLQGSSKENAIREIEISVDRLIYYAGWCDKYNQILSSVNPVSSSHFNFSVLEPMGVVGVIAPEDTSLLGLISIVLPAIVGGNTCVIIASEKLPLSAVTFAEVVNSSDVPGGVLNILTGTNAELIDTLASHMDVNAIVYGGNNNDSLKNIQELAVNNVKRVFHRNENWFDIKAQGLYAISDTQELKTTWHPIENIGGSSSSY